MHQKFRGRGREQRHATEKAGKRITVGHKNKERAMPRKTMTTIDDDNNAVCHSEDADERSLPFAHSVLSKANKIMTKMQ